MFKPEDVKINPAVTAALEALQAGKSDEAHIMAMVAIAHEIKCLRLVLEINAMSQKDLDLVKKTFAPGHLDG
jgi:hypothetical protein